uniref:Ig-like domain-containing protein n=1 Tax=Haplochromis burtoni TaxID=8153 RepID=A0A3Q2V6Z8_HAPBU
MSIKSQIEGKQLLHLQVITEQDLLPSEKRLTYEKPTPEHAGTRKSPTFCTGLFLMVCSLTGSSPMEVVWHKDNITISSEENYVMKCEKNTYSLHIKSLELTDQGVYLCKASNSVGVATFAVELKVIDKPRFVTVIEPVSAAVNDPLRLECHVNEDTGVAVTWTRDGKKVHQSMECKLSFEDKVAVLEIPKSKLKDSGKYVCTAANEAGSSSCESKVSLVLVLTILLLLFLVM